MKNSSFANRGMQLERFIELTNTQYKRDNVAVIQKIATPVKVLHRGHDGKITGFYESKSTVDFIGCYQGQFVCFDAKETKGKNLPLKNIHEHQIGFMKTVVENGGKAFIVVCFSELERYFVMNSYEIVEAIENTKAKSMPLLYFENHAREIKFNECGYVLDYLGVKL